jgi:hypothetical protein
MTGPLFRRTALYLAFVVVGGGLGLVALLVVVGWIPYPDYENWTMDQWRLTGTAFFVAGGAFGLITAVLGLARFDKEGKHRRR